MDYIDNVYVINLDSSSDRLQSIKQQLDKIGIDFTRISAVNGKKMSKEEVRENCTQFAQMFCPKNIIGCAMSHKKVWQKIVDNDDKYAIVFEDDCKISSKFKRDLKRSLDELILHDKEWDFLYLGYFGPAKSTSSTIMNRLQNLILNKIPKRECNLKNIFIPVSPVGFHSYIISQKCAKKLLKFMDKINYHIDSEFLSYAKHFNVYATQKKLGNQYSTVENSTLNEYKFPKLINWFSDKIIDIDGISYSYWLGSPIIQINDIPINLYFIIFIICLYSSNQIMNLIMMIYIYLESSLDVRNKNIISIYMMILYMRITRKIVFD